MSETSDERSSIPEVVVDPWVDRRPLAALQFARDTGDDEVGERVRKLLAEAGVKIAEDIALLGCTGLAGVLGSLDAAVFVRKNMAGAGIGLTCFVPPDRFCLVHNTIGGLEKNQKQRHPEVVAAITRDLTGSERGHVALVEAARRTKGSGDLDRMHKTLDQLQGEALPPGFEEIDDRHIAGEDIVESMAVAAPVVPAAPVAAGAEAAPVASDAELLAALRVLKVAVEFGADEVIIMEALANLPAQLAVELRPLALLAARVVAEPNWTCPDHETTSWKCRLCLAAAVARGPLVPQFLVASGADRNQIDMNTIVDPRDIDKTIDQIVGEQDTGEVSQTVALYVKAVVWRRRLTRD